MASVTLNGVTYNDGPTGPNNLANGGHRTNLLPMLGNAVQDLSAKQAAALASANAAAASQTTAQNAAASAANAPGTSATASNSISIALGSVSLTIQAGKLFSIGQQIIIASTASPTNWMAGTITAYNSGTGALTVTTTNISGSGIFAAWTVSLSGAPGLTGVVNTLKGAPIASGATLNLTSTTGNLVHITGSIAIAGMTLAAGASRVLIFDNFCSIIHSVGGIELPGGQNVIVAQGDVVYVYSDGGGKCICDVIRGNGAGAVSTGFSNLTVLTTSQNWVAPHWCTRGEVTVIAGGASCATDTTPRHGGAASGMSIKVTPIVPSATYTVVIGAGGAAPGVIGSGGNPGGTSSFSGPGITTITVPGAPASTRTGPSVTGSIGTGGDLNLRGAAGGVSIAGSGAAGVGGASPLIGCQALQSYAGVPSLAGQNFGAGGGGSYNDTGAAGAPGCILIRY